MEVEFLKNLGLDSNAIAEVQKEWGKEVETLKADKQALQIENKNLKDDIAVKDGIIKAKQEKLSEFENIDVDKLKTDEYDRGKKDAQKEFAQFKMESALEKALSGAGAKNTKILKGLLDMDKISFENDELSGLDEQIEQIRKDNDYLFESQTPPPKFTKETKTQANGEITKEQFAKMGYGDRMKIYSESPELYNELKGD